jgi:hypothetical protein
MAWLPGVEILGSPSNSGLIIKRIFVLVDASIPIGEQGVDTFIYQWQRLGQKAEGVCDVVLVASKTAKARPAHSPPIN